MLVRGGGGRPSVEACDVQAQRLAVALGGDCLADVGTLRAEPGVFGPVASDLTVSRLVDALAAAGPKALSAIRTARAGVREHVWKPAGTAAPDTEGQVIVDLDGVLVLAHSEKQVATATWKKTFGHHPLMAFVDHGSGGSGEPVAALPVVDEPHQRVVPVGPLPGGCGVLLVGVRDHQHPVEVDGHRPARIRCTALGQLPDPLAGSGPCGTSRLQGLLAGGGESFDQTGDRRIGGHRPEHGRLGPQHADIREAVPAQCDRQGHVQQDLARIVHRPSLPPRRERC